tara:strand:- start:378 stop:554 length:177 start_codon:yes stop_codon:yes gene_type:complete
MNSSSKVGLVIILFVLTSGKLLNTNLPGYEFFLYWVGFALGFMMFIDRNELKREEDET